MVSVAEHVSALLRGRLRCWQDAVQSILAHAAALQCRSDAELLRQSHQCRWEAKGGTPLAMLLPTVYAIAVEASRRTLGMCHYPVQLMGAIAMFNGRIAEMQTGEGKTLTAIPVAALRALPGKGCHVVTANDYLAKRDAEMMGSVYQCLGLTVGCVQPTMSDDERREQYARDITYMTGAEAGFDFLRDRLRLGVNGDRPRRAYFQANRGQSPVQRGHYFALIDEADGILIDSARTPLIIGMEEPDAPPTVAMYYWAHEAARSLVLSEDFFYEAEKRSVWLSEAGCRRLTLLAKPRQLDTICSDRLYDQVERSLLALHGYHRNRDYVVLDDEIRLVSEGSGRQLTGQRWQKGLHQAVEVKEGLPITSENRTTARITVQSYFSKYQYLAGMTGTASQARNDLRRYYRVGVSVIPTHRPCIRAGWPTRIFVSQASKRKSLVVEMQRLLAGGRAILVGTPSVRASESLADEFQRAGIPHAILNAIHHEEEAIIVAEAGQPGRVTVATNMAGRGTDIILHDDVRRSGGLHVIATEMHSSPRIDRQLVGRAARQGDPGSFQFFLSLEDELLLGFNPSLARRLQTRAHPNEDGELDSSWIRLFQRVQRKIERRHVRQRREIFKSECERVKRFRRAGFDPYLELVD